MTATQNQIAKRRLILGITNVGFWVAASTTGIALGIHFGPVSIEEISLLRWMTAVIAIQSLFDFVGGTVFMPRSPTSVGFFQHWTRGVLVHSTLLVGTGVLSYWSFQLTKGFYLSVAAVSLALLFWRTHILRLGSGARSWSSSFEGNSVWDVDSRDPSFTGGTLGIGPTAVILLPAPWRAQLTSTQLQTLIERRLWEIRNNLPMRSFLTALVWNLAGCKLGSVLLNLHANSPAQAVLLQCAWMTLWGFLGLLILPSLSRGSVFSADRAATVKGFDAKDWIQKFPVLTGEDGNSKTFVQRIFYPIPSAAERMSLLDNSTLPPPVGSVARLNLFLSLATLTILGRCVHCNVGRPELWIFPPTD